MSETQRNRAFLLLLLLLPPAIIAIHPLANNDLPLHLAIGEWILEHGEIPDQDPFSFTAPEQSWVPHEWLAAVIFVGAERMGGATGLLALAVLLSILLAAIHRALGGQFQFPIEDHLLWLPAVWVMAGRRLMLRPHLLALTYPFVVWWILLVGRSKPRLLWLLPLAMVIWVNSHGSYYLGLGIIGLDLIVCGRFTGIRPSIRWAVTVLCGLALFIQPYGPEGLLHPIRLTGDPIFMSEVREWAAPFGSSYSSLLFRDTAGFWLSIPWLVLVAFGLVKNRSDAPLAYRLFVVVTAILYLKHQRYLALFALASLPCLPVGLPIRIPQTWRTRLPIGIAIVTSLFFALVGYPVAGSKFRPVGIGWSSYLPLSEARLLVDDAEYDGNVVCEYHYGGVLAWIGKDRLKISMDSRNSVYGAETFQRHLAATRSPQFLPPALQQSPESLRQGQDYLESALLGRAGAVLIANPARHGMNNKLFWRLELDPEWNRAQLGQPGSRSVVLESKFRDRQGELTSRQVNVIDSAAILFLRKDHHDHLIKRLKESR